MAFLGRTARFSLAVVAFPFFFMATLIIGVLIWVEDLFDEGNP